MRRALIATAARVGQVTRQVTVERPDFVFATHVARVPGRAALCEPDRAVVPATAAPAAGAVGAACAAGAAAPLEPLPALPPDVSPPPAGAGASPVPRRAAVVAPAAVLLSVTVSVPLRVPPADGVNCTLTSHVAPGSREAPVQGSSTIAKSPPAIETPVTSSGRLPVLVSTDVTTSLVLPTGSVPKV